MSIDKAAMIWTMGIVIVAVCIAHVDHTTIENTPDKRTDSVYPGVGAKQTTETETTSVFLQTDKTSYTVHDQIKISGSVGNKLLDLPITLLVINSDGDLVTIAQLNVDDHRNFSEIINIGGPLWKQDGMYTIKMHYGENTAKTTFDFVLPAVTSELSDVFNVYVHDRIFSVDYSITNAKIKNMTMSSDGSYLTVMIDTQDYGTLTIDLPRDMINSKMSYGEDDIFFVLMDGIEIPYDEISTNSQSRIIQIKFDKGTSEIEIIGPTKI